MCIHARAFCVKEKCSAFSFAGFPKTAEIGISRPGFLTGAFFCIMGNFVPYDTKTLCGDAHRCVWKMPLVQPHPAYFYA